MTPQIRPEDLRILQFLYDRKAEHLLRALDAEVVAQHMGIAWNDLRYQIDRLDEEEYLDLKTRQIRSRRFHSLHLTTKGVRLVEAILNPPSLNLIKYHNFDLQFLPITVGLRVEVLNSPAGEAIGEVPLDAASIEQFVASVFEQNSSSQFGRSESRSTPASLEAVGNKIGQLLLPGDVRYCFETSMGMLADNTDERLRIRLRIYDNQLASIPWEIARIDDEYLSLRLKTPVVRYIPTSEPPGSLTTAGVLRILGVISNPTDLQQLDVDAERRVLERALAPLHGVRQVELTWLPDSRVQILQDALRQPYHALHFIGHGDYDEAQDRAKLAFTNENGKGTFVSAEWLATLIRDSSVRFVFLNSCESGRSVSGMASELVRRGIAAAVGFQSNVRDDVAIAFASGFYQALSDRWPVDAALVEGRKAIVSILDNNLNHSDWAWPTLYMRAPDGQLFQ